jgi:hypothetical protein
MRSSPDIYGTACKWSVPFGFDELRADGTLHQFLEGGIESLDMANLKRNTGFLGKLDQFIGFRDCPADGFLDQGRNPRSQEFGCNPMMVNRWRDNAYGIHFAEEAFVVIEWPGLESLRDGPGLLGIGIHHTDEFDILHFRKNPGVVLPQMPNSNHCQPQAAHEFTRIFGQIKTSCGSCNCLPAGKLEAHVVLTR